VCVSYFRSKWGKLHAGPDGIPPEIFKDGGDAMVTKLTKLLQKFWEEGLVPQDIKDANIIHLYKNKGNRASCDNHRASEPHHTPLDGRCCLRESVWL
jgi:hypothetical protein